MPVGPRAQAATLGVGSYLGAAASHEVLGDGIDLILHLDLLEPIVCYSYPKHTEVCPSEVQSQELSVFCRETRDRCEFRKEKILTEPKTKNT